MYNYMKENVSREREGKEFAARVLQAAPFVVKKSIYYEEKAWNNASYIMHRIAFMHSFVIHANGLEQIVYSLDVESRRNTRDSKRKSYNSQANPNKRSEYYVIIHDREVVNSNGS